MPVAVTNRPVVDGDPTGLCTLAGVEATLLPSDPPRDSELAFWLPPGTSETVPGADDTLTLVLPAGRGVRRREVAVRRVPVADLLDDLIRLPADAPVGPSVRAWSVAARLAVELVARGRVLPAISPSGIDAWRLGPLDPDDLVRRRALTAALPAAGYAAPRPEQRPLTVPSPDHMVVAFADAVADIVPRTSVAPVAAGHDAFAAVAPTDVTGDRAWFEAVHARDEQLVITLRLDPPDKADGAFVGTLTLQSADDPSLIIHAADLWDAPDTVLARFGDAETTLLLALRRAARAWPPIGRLLDDARPDRIELADAETDEVLGPAVDDLASAGIQVQWPVEMLEEIDLRPTIGTPAPAKLTGAGLTLESLLQLRWQASLDGEPLSDAELTLLANAKRHVVRLRGRWVRADPERLARLRDRHDVGAGAALGVALGGELIIDGEPIEADVEGPLADLGQRLSDLDLDRSLPEPAGLEATLRPYQRRGLAWLAEMADLGLGGVLADDMGLGKTIQVIALHLARQCQDGAGGPTLIICPATLVANWERETARFAPALPVRRFHGTGRSLDDVTDDELVVTTYGVVRRDAEALDNVGWGLVVADEAQAVKNPHTRGARALRTIGSGTRFALTGTPVENQLSELWAICDWTTPGLLGPLPHFQNQIAKPIERDQDPSATAWLSTLIRPFVLRRKKTDPGIAPELPPKTETDRFISLTAEQATLYRAVVDETMAEILEAEGIARRGLVLKLLTALKQICNHPAHYLGQTEPLRRRSAKLDAVAELLDVITAEGDAALVFTQYVAMGRLLESYLTKAGLRVGFLHGTLGLTRRQELVDAFQNGEIDVFLLSLKAGGTGLNLTAATHVIHYDRWWNPAVEDQASDRAWRIGQDRPVQIHRMVCEGTVEDRIATILESKRALADAVVGGGEAWVSELNDDDLNDLVELSMPGTD